MLQDEHPCKQTTYLIMCKKRYVVSGPPWISPASCCATGTNNLHGNQLLHNIVNDCISIVDWFVSTIIYKILSDVHIVLYIPLYYNITFHKYWGTWICNIPNVPEISTVFSISDVARFNEGSLLAVSSKLAVTSLGQVVRPRSCTMLTVRRHSCPPHHPHRH